MAERAFSEVEGFSTLQNNLEQSFSINGKAKSTLNNYLRCLAHLALHYNQSPEKLSVENIEEYLYYCQKLHKTPSESFFKHTIFGLRAAYKVMGMEAKRVALPQIKRDLKLPTVLSQKEVKRLLNAPKYLKHRLIIGMLYGCGLRSYELCNLKLADIDFDRRTVFIPKKKGKVDRYVPLSKHLARGLKKYIKTENPQIYLFNSQVYKDGKARGLTTNGIRWVIKENRSKIGSSKKITAHTLRHSFATHLLEYGVDIVSLKELLGHAHIEMTLTYLHVANLPSGSKFSPLDRLYK
ncbi:integrase family protein [Gillisia limnaea DSM 15749]|uniref:Integrase family protein n=1 Tax=Gillisia limnaea (strain DSM 15749 / LMG 21470 / R-8282) TaxID=865937 RepID=H2BQK4_GILLR|nr:integrase family protein [Gillisia limnaea DSM 15749]